MKEQQKQAKQAQEHHEQMNRNRRHKNNPLTHALSLEEETPKTSIIDDLNIQKKLRKVLEESDDEYEMPFKDANDLMSIFENLEEKNLFLI